MQILLGSNPMCWLQNIAVIFSVSPSFPFLSHHSGGKNIYSQERYFGLVITPEIRSCSAIRFRSRSKKGKKSPLALVNTAAPRPPARAASGILLKNYLFSPACSTWDGLLKIPKGAGWGNLCKFQKKPFFKSSSHWSRTTVCLDQSTWVPQFPGHYNAKRRRRERKKEKVIYLQIIFHIEHRGNR